MPRAQPVCGVCACSSTPCPQWAVSWPTSSRSNGPAAPTKAGSPAPTKACCCAPARRPWRAPSAVPPPRCCRGAAAASSASRRSPRRMSTPARCRSGCRRVTRPRRRGATRCSTCTTVRTSSTPWLRAPSGRSTKPRSAWWRWARWRPSSSSRWPAAASACTTTHRGPTRASPSHASPTRTRTARPWRRRRKAVARPPTLVTWCTSQALHRRPLPHRARS